MCVHEACLYLAVIDCGFLNVQNLSHLLKLQEPEKHSWVVIVKNYLFYLRRQHLKEVLEIYVN